MLTRRRRLHYRYHWLEGKGYAIVTINSRLGARNCSIWSITPREVRVISLPWVVIRGKRAIL